MILVVEDRLKKVSTPNGRSMEQIVHDINSKCEGTSESQELIDMINFLVDRLTYTDAERFGA